LLEAVAELAQWSLSTMSRIETGNRRISTADVATLCAIYRLPLAQRERLIEAARTGNPITSGDGMIAGTPAEMSTLASYEADAIRITDCSMTVVPGLLQTRDYAVGMMSTGRTDFGDPEGAVAETGAQATSARRCRVHGVHRRGCSANAVRR
jgi:hypothetical protein